MDQQSEFDAIKQLTQMFIDTSRDAAGVDLRLDEASVMMLDEIISKSWGGKVPENVDRLVELIGAFFGEALVATLGMHWMKRPEDGQWVVTATAPNRDEVTTNPFNKVYKRFVNGEEDSVSYFYAMLKKMLAGEFKV